MPCLEPGRSRFVTQVAIGLGSNLGDRRAHLYSARRALGKLGREVAASSVYETAPIGPVEQGAFLNAVVVIDTDRAPVHLLGALLEIEQRHHRLRDVQWGPRTLDLDILLYGSEDVDLPGLRVPHAELTRRRFAVEPLLEAWPDATLPDGRRLEEFVAGVADQDVSVDGPWMRARWWTRWRDLIAGR